MKIREIILSYGENVDTPLIRKALDALPVFRALLSTNAKEHFLALYLDGNHKPINYSIVTIGLVNSSQVHPREVFRPAIACGATALIVAHNHPSGSMVPSEQDKAVTVKLKQAADIIGIKLLDHIIFDDVNSYSMQEMGDL